MWRTIFVVKNILIAEDDIPSRKILSNLAKEQGYHVIAVGNGVDLLTVVNETNIDVIITDLMMPYLNGASAVDIMLTKGDKTPVIAVTGMSSNDVSSIKDKFTKIYHKPLNTNELFEYVKSLF
jgi:CheY-like chemotaxis protein